MKIQELEHKYGKKLINKILKEKYLDGCTITINKDRTEDIPEEDIIRSIKEIKGKNISSLEWD